ncbi:Aste57867_20138 [Aphanomyces stellatus]|uniref:protein-tyrosine-phosphatase n=1 Tax=Aphanomyces stellatus TaxID=120398 RepID=A0A485LEA4_9STRA|nr:hypothetical protein As57867_020072 [Aphanomyces stellatus]VFT96833.1 Aste57867_20138 [Aphanomyces stellatus]
MLDGADSDACTPQVVGMGLTTPVLSRTHSDMSTLGYAQRRRLLSRTSKRALFSPECVPEAKGDATPATDNADVAATNASQTKRPRKHTLRDILCADDSDELKENETPVPLILNRSMSSPGPMAAFGAYTPILPVIKSSKHPDLNVISPETVKLLLDGDFDSALDGGFHLVDCRFQHEFLGGSLRGAVSLALPPLVEDRFFRAPTDASTRTALVFFCEFSAKRAPKMARHVRNLDRRLHADVYPKLHYPEVYLIDGGYKHCFESGVGAAICKAPASYVPMDAADHAAACKQELSALRASWKQLRTPLSKGSQSWC